MNCSLANVRSSTQIALFSGLGSALLLLAAPSQAFSATLSISGTPAHSVTVGQQFLFQPTAKDPTKSPPHFNIVHKPMWANFNQKTGLLSGWPNGLQVGTYAHIVIRVTNRDGYVALPAFSVAVISRSAAAGTPPVTTPPVVKVPVKAPPVVNVPVTTPPVVKVPVTTPPVVKVPVTPPTPVGNQAYVGNAALDWTAPTENTDGSVLTNLAGYNVHYGNSPTHLTQIVKVANPGLTSFVVENLTSGTWYFAVTSYASSGLESSNSGVISTTIL